eukprot:58299_1
MSKQQRDRKQNSTLKTLSTAHEKNFYQHQWSFRYEFQNHHTHCLLFTNDNKIHMNPSAVQELKSMDISDIEFPKTDQIPLYFMQITSIDEDAFHVKILADKICSVKRKLFIKEINKSNNNGLISPIKIDKGKISAERDIDLFSQHDNVYQLAIYDNKTATEPVLNSTPIQLVTIKDENKLPPKNNKYKPNCINLASVIK